MNTFVLYMILALAPPLQEAQQETQGTPVKTLTVRLPKFYTGMVAGMQFGGGAGENFLKLPPEAEHWHFESQEVDSAGKPTGPPVSMEQGWFYTAMQIILLYGVKDSADPTDRMVNPCFEKLVKQLVEWKILDKENIHNAVDKYVGSNWAESAYFLDNAVPGLITVADWQKMEQTPYGGSNAQIYMQTLCRIKLAKGNQMLLLDARDLLWNCLSGRTPCLPVPATFQVFFASYVILAQNGIEMSDVARESVLDLYINYDPKFQHDVTEIFKEWGMKPLTKNDLQSAFDRWVSLPGARLELVKECRKRGFTFPLDRALHYLIVIVNTLENCDLADARYLAGVIHEDFTKFATPILQERISKELETNLKLLPHLRQLAIPFPKARAAEYRDKLLENFDANNFVDLEYVLAYCDNIGMMPEKVKHYADDMLDWHFDKENIHRKEDQNDSFHAAVECYRMLAPMVAQLQKERDALGTARVRGEDAEKQSAALKTRIAKLQIQPERITKMLTELDNPDVRLHDLLWAIQLKDDAWRTNDTSRVRLEARILESRKLLAGAEWDKDFRMFWHVGNNHIERGFYRDEIELALNLQDPVRIQALMGRIVADIRNRIMEEGDQILKDYPERRCNEGVSFDEYRWRLESSDTPAYVNLAAVINQMVALKFEAGLRMLAQTLHDFCFEKEAVRCFKLVGLGTQESREKKDREKEYPDHPDFYWQAREARFNFEMRAYGTFDNSK